MITYRTGNAAEPVERPAVIVHIVNDVGAWGAGFVLPLGTVWPRAQSSYRAWASAGIKRGTCLLVALAPHVYVAHIAAQRGLRSRINPKPIDYPALESALASLAANMPPGASVHMPRIGRGLAGGDWSIVEPMIARALDGFDVFVYDLPKRNP